MTELPVYKIFLSSPGDVAEERALAEFVFRRLADEVSDVAQLRFVIWEHEPLFGHAGFQQQLERPSQCDLVVSILWSRLGTRLPSDFAPVEGQPAMTGTEFEIQDALVSYAQRAKPNLLIYRKIPGPQIALGSEDFAERSDQYRRLEEFCRRAFYDKDGAVAVAHHTFNDSHTFERRLATHLRRWVDQVLHLPQSERFRPFWRGESPFRGLQSFDAEHHSVYFGRAEAISDLMRRVRDTEITGRTESVARLLLVQGMSGTGKTSLFRAGLLPLLGLRPVEGVAQWITFHMHPAESDPAMRERGGLGVLAARLTEHVPAIERLGTTADALAEDLFERPATAATKIETSIAADAAAAVTEPGRTRLLIYIDQMEEVFSNPDSTAAEAPLLAAMVALAKSGSIWIAASIRSDFVHRLEAHPELMKSLAGSPPYTLLPPRPDELAEMIREPARAAGLIWEERHGISLDQELLRDASAYPESLPLLEYTLSELYERREGRELRWSQYEGGLKGALISAADEVVAETSGDIDIAFRDVMRELVSVGEDGAATRRYASLSRFHSGGAARALLDRFVARRLCVTTDEGRGDGPVTSLAHEALIRSWPRAQEWLQRETSLLRIRDELARDAAAWEYHGRIDDWLGVSSEKIAAIRRIETAGLMPTGAATDYAQRSRHRRRRNSRIRRAALVGICTLTVLAGIAWWLALQQRNTARIEAATSGRTTQFMVGLFQLADPGENRGDKVTVKEVLDKGAQEIRSDTASNTLRSEPRVRAELLTAMGQAYSGLGLYQPAEDLLRLARADQSASSVPAESRIRTLIASGATAQSAGQYDEAVKELGRAVDLARSSLSPSNELRSKALTSYAEALAQIDKFPDAIGACKEALAADRQRGPTGDEVLAATLASIGVVYLYSGDLAAAEAPIKESLEIRRRIFGMRHALTARSLSTLAAIFYQSGKYTEAASLYIQALPIYREIYGPEHPEVASIENNLGRSTLVAGHVDEAEPLLRQALATFQKFQSNDFEALVGPLNSLAMIDAYRGRTKAATAEINQAESIARLPDQGELLDQVLLNEADIEMARGNRERAAALLAESKILLEKAHPAEPVNAWRYAVWDLVNVQMLASRGDTVSAVRDCLAASKILEQRFGKTGFYSLLAQRRTQFLAGTRPM